jgi:LysM repeat protein
MRTPIKHGLLVSFVMALILSAAGSAAAAPAAVPAADGPNLLQNPGFESPFVKQCCQTDLSIYYPNTPIDEVQVASGWSGWWLQPGLDPQHPGSGGTPSWHRPEWREANCGSVCANRVRSGSNAQKYFTFWSVHDAGMYQQVSGITPGAPLRFSVYMQAWSVNTDYGPSNPEQNMGMRVGIDPFGGTDAFSSDVIWSDSFDTFDTWGLYSIEATARGGTVTVFTRSTPHYGNEHNDIYVDDASLVVMDASNAGGGNNQPPAPPPTVAPAPVTGFSYVVQRGDNFYRLAQRFGVSLSLLYEVNHITNPNILFIGTVLIIPGATPTEAVPPAPQPTATTSPADLPGAFAYVVQPGDNLWRLSVRFGVSIARIKQLNGLVGDIIFIGQTLIIAP